MTFNKQGNSGCSAGRDLTQFNKVTLGVQQAAEEHFGQTVADQPFNPERLIRKSLGSRGSQKVAQGVFGS